MAWTETFILQLKIVTGDKIFELSGFILHTTIPHPLQEEQTMNGRQGVSQAVVIANNCPLTDSSGSGLCPARRQASPSFPQVGGT